MAASKIDSTVAPATSDELPLVMVGAHMSGLALNGELVALGGRFLKAAKTAPRYRFFALPGGPPEKPGLVRTSTGGASIEVEIWSLPTERIGAFLERIPHPLGLGSIELADGAWVKGFLCEPAGTAEALDITSFGGWRAFLSARQVK